MKSEDIKVIELPRHPRAAWMSLVALSAPNALLAPNALAAPTATDGDYIKKSDAGINENSVPGMERLSYSSLQECEDACTANSRCLGFEDKYEKPRSWLRCLVPPLGRSATRVAWRPAVASLTRLSLCCLAPPGTPRSAYSRSRRNTERRAAWTST